MVEIKSIKNLFNNDPDSFVTSYDFSTANLNEENRLLAITTVASICYQNPKAVGSESLYNRLLAESKGLPSSSFEFVPVLLDFSNIHHTFLLHPDNKNIRKFGQELVIQDKKYLLTNLRAIVYDYEAHAARIDNDTFNEELKIQYFSVYNTPEECCIIKDNFFVFLFNVDLATRAQMVRHRVNWQELSRRYVSGSRVPFSFYVSEKMKDIESSYTFDEFQQENTLYTEDVIQICVNHYYAALEKGVKPEEARRIIPQAMFTKVWGAFQKAQLDNFFKLRLDSHAQFEIRQVANAMRELIQ